MRLRYTIGGFSERSDWLDPLDKRFEERAIVDLVRELNRDSVVAFLGSAVTVAYGRPTWSQLTEAVERDIKGLISEGDYEQYRNYFAFDLKDEIDDAAHKLARLQVCDQILHKLSLDEAKQEALGNVAGLKNVGKHRTVTVADLLKRQFIKMSKEPAELKVWRDPIRVMIEDLGVKRFLTTNYDDDVERWFEQNAHRLYRPSDEHRLTDND